MTFTRETLDGIVELAEQSMKAEFKTIHGVDYIVNNGDLERILKDSEHSPSPVALKTLSSLKGYIDSNPDGLELEKCFIVVQSPTSVHLCSITKKDFKNSRWVFANVTAPPCPFVFGESGPSRRGYDEPWYNLLDFVIALQSQFQESENVDNIITMLSNLHNTKVIQKNDDGFTQALQVSTGLTTKANVEIKNPVTLAPYRTFREIDQPPGKFILRFKESEGDATDVSCSLFVADGGQWEFEAVESIAMRLKALMINKSIPILY